MIFELYDVPEIARDYLHFFISDKEIEVIEFMKKSSISDEDLKLFVFERFNISRIETQSFIFRLYHRGIINMIPDENENLFWQINDFWKRMTFLAQYESFRWKEIPQKVRDELDQMYVDSYGDDAKIRLEKVQKGELKSIENAYFFTLEETLRMIDKTETDIYIIPCNCKRLKLGCEDKKPYDCCMAFTKGINSEWDRGYGTEISKEEAKELVKKFRRSGLMQSSEAEWGLCNCCGCCCYPIRSSEKVGTKGLWPLQRYEIIWHEDKCINCGACSRICNFEAFTTKDKQTSFNKDKCWGCTICYERCPKEAIELKKIVDDSIHGISFD